MGLPKNHWLFVAPALLAQGAWLFGTYEAIATMEGLNQTYGFWRPEDVAEWFLWVLLSGVVRLSATTWGLLTTRRRLWCLPLLAAGFELWLYSTQVATAFGYLETFSEDLNLLSQALVTPGFRHFWLLPLAPTIIVPTLALRAYRLVQSDSPRAA